MGDRIATLAWNTARHIEAWYGIMGIGAIYHTLNPRLFPEQIVWIMNHAEDKAVFDQCTDTIVRQVDDIRRMVDEFSRFARMPKPVMEGEDAADTVRQAVFLMKVAHPDLDIETDIKQDPLQAQFDRRLISQAVTNIIKNATEAIEQVPPEELGKGRIDVIAARENDDIVIDVIDNGIGLPKVARARLLSVKGQHTEAVKILKTFLDRIPDLAPDALIRGPGPLTTVYRARIVEFAARHRWPAMYDQQEFVNEGGLMVYAANWRALYQRAAALVDKILKGANPAEIPVEQPMRFDFAINLTTARALGLEIPRQVLLQATEVIE